MFVKTPVAKFASRMPKPQWYLRGRLEFDMLRNQRPNQQDGKIKKLLKFY